jgi:hypothetical protein
MASVLHQSVTIGRHEMRHRAALPNVPVQPQSAVHREDHPIPARDELAIRTIVRCGASIGRETAHARLSIGNQLQVMRPSTVDGATAVAVPKYTVHFSAPSDMCVAEADQPPAVASGTTIVTPVEVT